MENEGKTAEGNRKKEERKRGIGRRTIEIVGKDDGARKERREKDEGRK